jgi:hypothetical protein
LQASVAMVPHIGRHVGAIEGHGERHRRQSPPGSVFDAQNRALTAPKWPSIAPE